MFNNFISRLLKGLNWFSWYFFLKNLANIEIDLFYHIYTFLKNWHLRIFFPLFFYFYWGFFDIACFMTWKCGKWNEKITTRLYKVGPTTAYFVYLCSKLVQNLWKVPLRFTHWDLQLYFSLSWSIQLYSSRVLLLVLLVHFGVLLGPERGIAYSKILFGALLI